LTGNPHRPANAWATAGAIVAGARAPAFMRTRSRLGKGAVHIGARVGDRYENWQLCGSPNTEKKRAGRSARPWRTSKIRRCLKWVVEAAGRGRHGATACESRRHKPRSEGERVRAAEGCVRTACSHEGYTGRPGRKKAAVKRLRSESAAKKCPGQVKVPGKKSPGQDSPSRNRAGTRPRRKKGCAGK